MWSGIRQLQCIVFLFEKWLSIVSMILHYMYDFISFQIGLKVLNVTLWYVQWSIVVKSKIWAVAEKLGKMSHFSFRPWRNILSLLIWEKSPFLDSTALAMCFVLIKRQYSIVIRYFWLGLRHIHISCFTELILLMMHTKTRDERVIRFVKN